MPRVVAVKSASSLGKRPVSINKSNPITLQNVNSFLTCPLCTGYLIDASTLAECGHSFCRSCLYAYSRKVFKDCKELEPLACPICGTTQNLFLTRPQDSIRPDHLLQNLVYKIVPGLLATEIKRRRDFQKLQTQPAQANENGTDEKPGSPKTVSIQLEHADRNNAHFSAASSESPLVSSDSVLNSSSDNAGRSPKFNRIYLRCPVEMTAFQLKKFISIRYSLGPYAEISLYVGQDQMLHDSLSLAEAAVLYECSDALAPLVLHFSTIDHKVQTKRRTRNSSGNRKSPSPLAKRMLPTAKPNFRQSAPGNITNATAQSDGDDDDESVEETRGQSSSLVSPIKISRRVSNGDSETGLPRSAPQTVSPTTTSSFACMADPDRPKITLKRVSSPSLEVPQCQDNALEIFTTPTATVDQSSHGE